MPRGNCNKITLRLWWVLNVTGQVEVDARGAQGCPLVTYSPASRLDRWRVMACSVTICTYLFPAATGSTLCPPATLIMHSMSPYSDRHCNEVNSNFNATWNSCQFQLSWQSNHLWRNLLNRRENSHGLFLYKCLFYVNSFLVKFENCLCFIFIIFTQAMSGLSCISFVTGLQQKM